MRTAPLSHEGAPTYLGDSDLIRRRLTSLERGVTLNLLTALEAHDWFLGMMRDHEEFEVETDEPGEWPVPFSSETVRRVVVE